MEGDGLIRFKCPRCGKGLTAKPELAGKQLACPNCKALLTVPPSNPSATADDIFGDSLAEALAAVSRPSRRSRCPAPPPLPPASAGTTVPPRKTKSFIALYIGGGVGAALLILLFVVVFATWVLPESKMTLEKEKKTVRTDATIERETVQTDSPSLNQSAAEAAVRICLDITNRRYVVNQFYPLESLESAFIFEDGGVSKDGRNWGRGWVPLDDCIPQLVSGGKALEWGRVAATKEIWGLRAQFTADEGFGRATSSDRIFFLDDSKQVIGSLPTAVVRLVHGATRAAKAGDSTEVERAIADLQSPEPSQRRDAADRLTFAARQGAFRKTEISETDKRAAVTGLANRLRDVDGNARSAAIKALAAIGPPAKSAVPALIELMHSGGEAPIDPGGWTPVGDLLTLTIDCLGAMVSASPEALAELIGLVKKPLESKDADYRTWDLACAATRALGKAGPDAEQAVPILMDVLRYAVAEPPGGDQAFSKPYSRAGIYGIAAEAIAAIGSGRPMPLLNAHRKGTDVRTETPADRQQIMQDADTAYRKLEWKMASPPKDPPTQKQDPAAQWRATHPSAEKQLDRIVSDLRNDPSANKVLPHPKQPERLRLFSPAGK